MDKFPKDVRHRPSRSRFEFMSHVKGIVAFSYIALNLLVCFVPLLALIAVKALTPSRKIKEGVYRLMNRLYSFATRVDEAFLWRFTGTELDIRGEIAGPADRTHLILANHRTWTDILILQSVFNEKTPVLKFLVKKQILRIPLVGWICWAFEYPFVEPQKSADDRMEAQFRLKNDLAAINPSPASLVNFVEGSRYTDLKRDRQNCSYQNLLSPRAGGLRAILREFGESLEAVYDLTLVYSPTSISFWDFLRGRCAKIVIEVRRIARPDLLFPPTGDSADRERTQAWIDNLWREKDILMGRIIGDL